MTENSTLKKTSSGTSLPRPMAIGIVFMGDSITFGQYVEAPFRWTDIVSDRLTRKYLKSATNLMFLNRGVSGETTRQGLERFPRDVQSVAPDIMTLQFGLNDCNCWVTDRGLPRVSELAYRANLIEMIERARRFGTKRVILSTNHPTLRHKMLLSGQTLEERRVRYNDIVREVATATRVELCEIDRAFSALDSRNLAKLLLPYPDELHLSAEGHQVYADAIYGPLEAAIANAENELRESVT